MIVNLQVIQLMLFINFIRNTSFNQWHKQYPFFCYCCIRILYLYTLFKHSVGNKLYQYITWNGPLCIVLFFLFYLAFIAYACSIDSKCFCFDTEGNFYGKGVTVAGKGDGDLYLFLNK